MITFVVPIGNTDVYNRCFMSSPMLRLNTNKYQIIGQSGYKNAALAFNDAIEISDNDIMVFLHQDVILPWNWGERFISNLNEIERKNTSIGVIGCVGVTKRNRQKGHIYRHSKELYNGDSLPAEVQTIDEMLVCFRKSTGLKFDTKLPGFYFYGMDVCLKSIDIGLKNYIIDSPCFHQAVNRDYVMPKKYWQAYRYVLNKWGNCLPIYTNSGAIYGYRSYYKKRIMEIINKLGYSPVSWWKNLPDIDPDKILNEDK